MKSSDSNKNSNLKRSFTRKILRRNNRRKFKKLRNWDEICCIKLRKQRHCSYLKTKLNWLTQQNSQFNRIINWHLNLNSNQSKQKPCSIKITKWLSKFPTWRRILKSISKLKMNLQRDRISVKKWSRSCKQRLKILMSSSKKQNQRRRMHFSRWSRKGKKAIRRIKKT